MRRMLSKATTPAGTASPTGVLIKPVSLSSSARCTNTVWSHILSNACGAVACHCLCSRAFQLKVNRDAFHCDMSSSSKLQGKLHVNLQYWNHFSVYARHLCVRAMLIFSVLFQLTDVSEITAGSHVLHIQPNDIILLTAHQCLHQQ